MVRAARVCSKWSALRVVRCGVGMSGSCAGVAFDDDAAAGIRVFLCWASVCSRGGCRGAYEIMIWVRVWLRMMGIDSSFNSVQASVVAVGNDDDDDRFAVLMMIIGDDDGTGGSAGDHALATVANAWLVDRACVGARCRKLSPSSDLESHTPARE